MIQSLSRDFSFQRERIFHVNICVLVYDCYFEFIVFVIILFWNLTQFGKNSALCLKLKDLQTNNRNVHILGPWGGGGDLERHKV